MHAESEQLLSPRKNKTKTHLTQPLTIKAETLSNEHVGLYSIYDVKPGEAFISQ